MSLDLIVLFDSRAPEATPEWLRQRLAASPAELAPAIERYRSRCRVHEWQRMGRDEAGRRDLYGPGGFAIGFRPHTVEVYHLIPFSRFASDVEAREELRHAWRWFSRQLGSPRAIYTHELMPHAGTDLSEVEAALRSTIGPPARDFAELASAADFGPKAWYIDDFATQDGTGS